MVISSNYGRDLVAAVSVAQYTRQIVEELNANEAELSDVRVSTYISGDGTQYFWRTAEDRRRINNLKNFEKLFLGQHEEIMRPDWLPTGKGPYRRINYARFITLLYTRLTMGNGVKIKTGNKTVDAYYNNHLQISLDMQYWFTYLSVYGFVALELRRLQNGEVSYKLCDPDVIYPQFVKGSRLDFEWISKKVLIDRRFLQLPDEGRFEFTSDEAKVVYEERHFKGFVEFYLYTSDNNDAIKRMLPVHWLYPELPPYRKFRDSDNPLCRAATGHDDFLITIIPNQVFNGNFISDYDDIAVLVESINNRWTQIGRTLNIHSDPKLIAPSSMRQNDPYTGAPIMRAVRDEVLFVTPEDRDQKPEYLVWNAQLDAQFTDLKQAIIALGTTADVAPQFLLLEESAYPDSAVALKLKLTPTLARSTEKGDAFREGITRFLISHLKLSMQSKVFETILDSVIPEDEVEDTVAQDQMTQDLLQIKAEVDKAKAKQKPPTFGDDDSNDDADGDDGDQEPAQPRPMPGFESKPPIKPLPEADLPIEEITKDTITIRYYPNIPQDVRLLIERLGAGTQSVSLKRVLKEVDNMTDKEAAEELVAIHEESVTNAAAAMSAFPGGMAGGGEFGGQDDDDEDDKDDKDTLPSESGEGTNSNASDDVDEQ